MKKKNWGIYFLNGFPKVRLQVRDIQYSKPGSLLRIGIIYRCTVSPLTIEEGPQQKDRVW